MTRFMLAASLGLLSFGLIGVGEVRSQPPVPPPITPAPAPEQKGLPPLPPPMPPEKKQITDPTDPTTDPRLNELLNPTRMVAAKQIPILIKGRVVTPTGANVLLDFAGRLVMLRKGSQVTIQVGDTAATYRVIEVNENEVLLQTPTKETLSIR